MPRDKDNLTPKQAKFCEQYMVDLNATQAAIRAGYSKKTAREIGKENLTKPLIAKRIKAAKEESSKDTGELVAKVLGGYKKIAFGRISKQLNNRHKLGALDSLGRHLGLFEKDNEQQRNYSLADMAAMAELKK